MWSLITYKKSFNTWERILEHFLIFWNTLIHISTFSFNSNRGLPILVKLPVQSSITWQKTDSHNLNNCLFSGGVPLLIKVNSHTQINKWKGLRKVKSLIPKVPRERVILVWSKFSQNTSYLLFSKNIWLNPTPPKNRF